MKEYPKVYDEDCVGKYSLLANQAQDIGRHLVKSDLYVAQK